MPPRRTLQSAKGLKDLFQLLAGDARAVILYADNGAFFLCIGLKKDGCRP